VDYRALHLATVKNQYLLAVITEMIEGVREARTFTKLDLHGAYNRLQIKVGDEYKTAFRTLYGEFKFWVMPFSLTNALATFLHYNDGCLRP
jgi:hypothetical protein